MTPELHRLARARDHKRLKELLESSPDARQAINEIDDGGATPLFYALDQETPDYNVIKLLLENGADTEFVRIENFPVIGDIAEFVADGIESITKKIALDINMDFIKKGTQYGEPLLSVALKHADLRTVKLLHENGADFSKTYKHGYNSVLNATYRSDEPSEIIAFLISLGLATDLTSKYGESAIVNAYRSGHFKTVKVLLDAGASDSKLKWTPLIRATAIGNLGDVLEEVYGDNDPNAKDCCDRTAMDTAVMKGDVEVCEYLLEHAHKEQGLPGGSAILTFAAQGGQATLVEKLVDLGHSVNSVGQMGETALMIAARKGDVEMVRMLLKLGADLEIESFGETALTKANDRATILALVEGGANPNGLDNGGRRRLIGLSESNIDLLSDLEKKHYESARQNREGQSNPENLTEPFRLAMIRSGATAHTVQVHFEGKYPFDRYWGTDEPKVWCFDRFGQTFTVLPNDNIVLIGGEHEDSYDPDFCIYNDVAVFSPDGKIMVYSYPYSVFEPTDFHTATLIGNEIFIIGGLGYATQRNNSIPVYRLSTIDWSIKRIETTGDLPDRIFEHRARLVNDRQIRIEGGTEITFNGEEESHNKNTHVYEFDVASSTWSRV